MENIASYKKIEMNNREILVFSSAEKLAEYAAEWLFDKINSIPEGTVLNLALSGGTTPKKIFSYISSIQPKKADLDKIRFFWGDERCVPPAHDESNYKMTRLTLLENLNISDDHVFRIYGEDDPAGEAVRYGKVLAENVPIHRGLPRFDIIMLGLGEDGHTASIFPGNMEVFHSENYCEAVAHPQTGQKRITLSGSVINNASNVVFFITGNGKAEILKEILGDTKPSGFPASHVNPNNGKLIWLLDDEAGRLLLSDN